MGCVDKESQNGILERYHGISLPNYITFSLITCGSKLNLFSLRTQGFHGRVIRERKQEEKRGERANVHRSCGYFLLISSTGGPYDLCEITSIGLVQSRANHNLF